MTYTPPTTDLAFLLKHLVGIKNLQDLGHDVTDDLIDSVLTGAGAQAAGDFAPLNHAGDKTGAKIADGKVTMPAGFKTAYQSFVAGGWNSVPFETDIGGMGLPWCMAYAVQELFQSANLSLALATLLNQGAIELLSTHGAPEIKNVYLPKLASGEWTGTMNLTESQAGTDVGAIRTTATPDGGFYRIRGQKIFISYGDHDMTDNIVHFVLARLPDAPEGSKGLSLFLVPKILVKPDGTLGKQNDIRVVSIEHKLGQHASPTCVLAYGDNEGAIGYLIGEQNGGITAMFTMMNNARIGVGIQGLALAERAYQDAAHYAKNRIQGRDMRVQDSPPAAIIVHPDVKRMLLTMKVQIEAARALVIATGYMADRSRMKGDVVAHSRLELYMPIVKSWLTDMSNEVTSLAIQVCGGMGYIEETGVAQHYRDARVLAIYEGTNGIQANDLVFRKLGRNHGATMYEICSELKRVEHEMLRYDTGDDCRAIRNQLAFARTDLETATQHMLELLKTDKTAAAASASTYLRLAAVAIGGLYMGHTATQAFYLRQAGSASFSHEFFENKIITARFYAEHILPQTTGLRMALDGHATINRPDADYF
jgi:alkylation response protein AidB-like acyl-CoA dehydrogenase